MAFAMIEATVFLATMMRAARFELVSGDYRPIPTSRVVLTPKDGLPLKVSLRGA
jgi:cytochrome P450